MPSETAQISVESNRGGMNYKETELTLRLPGDQSSPGLRSGMKRGYLDMVDLKLGSTTTDVTGGLHEKSQPETDNSDASKPPRAKEQVVGWPPVRAYRKNVLTRKSCKYVKVAVDGAPYLRKVDLEVYSGYEELLGGLEKLFSNCFTMRNGLKLMDRVNGTEYVPTYEDKDGDWMLVGDVPWKMFVETCKRVRLMKSSEAMGLGPRTQMPPSKCSSSSS